MTGLQLGQYISNHAGISISAVILIFATLIEIAPIKINPWKLLGKGISKLLNAIGKLFNGVLVDKIEDMSKSQQSREESLNNSLAIMDGKLTDLSQNLGTINDRVSQLEYTMEYNAIISARARILRFGDELAKGEQFTIEHFQTIDNDIVQYENYCKAHPEFPNNTTLWTIELIKDTFQKNRSADYANHKFIDIKSTLEKNK